MITIRACINLKEKLDIMQFGKNCFYKSIVSVIRA